MARPARIHYLRTNDAERSPHRLLVIDTETRWRIDGNREVHELRLWCARHVHRHGRQGRYLEVEDWSGDTADELADLVEQLARRKDVLWAFAHNLSFDLTVTQLPVLLARRGWEMGRHNLGSDAPWAHMKRRSHGLRLADSASWLPRPLEELGYLLGVPKLELPDATDDDASWRARCTRDVEITATAITTLMDRWDQLELGSWSITGPATGWNCMLHLAPVRRPRPRPGTGGDDERTRGEHLDQVPVIDPDPRARAFEREAIYSGRRDVWRWGRLPEAEFAEVDFKLAHLTICAHLPLPDRRSRAFERLALDDWHIGALTRSLVARCRVRTEQPRYPMRVRGAVLHPVGEFWTVLCGPEIAAARDRGDLLEVGAGRSYRLGRHMQPWAQWALDLLTRPAGEVDPMLLVALKGWARTVPGRWGMQVARELLSGPSHDPGWSLERASFGTPPRRGVILHMAGSWTELVRDQEPDDSFPAVLAHIQSWNRLYLQQALDRLGEDAALQVNTDSVICFGAALRQLAWEAGDEPAAEDGSGAELEAGARALSASTAPLRMVLKGWDRRLQLLSPQHVRLGRQRKYAGVPPGAEEVEPGVFRFWTWPKLAGQLERGEPGAYVRELRQVRLSEVPVSRWAYVDGCCEPVRATVTAEGETRLLPPGLDWCRRHGAALRPLQHPVLRRLL